MTACIDLTRPVNDVSLESLDRCRINGRGTVYAVTNPNPDMMREDLAALYTGQYITLDGMIVKCSGVETHALVRIRGGAPIGLLIADDAYWRMAPYTFETVAELGRLLDAARARYGADWPPPPALR